MKNNNCSLLTRATALYLACALAASGPGFAQAQRGRASREPVTLSPGNNALAITDYADNLQRIVRIISTLEVTNATDVDVIPLQSVLAAGVAPVVQRLIDASGGGAAPGVPGQPVAAGDGSART